MWSFGVLDEPPHILFQTLRVFFDKYGFPFQEQELSARDVHSLPYRDVWVLSHAKLMPAECRQLIVPGDHPPPLPPCAGGLITYGLSRKNSLTPSSIHSDSMLLSLQREIVTLSGTRLERQDFPVSRHPEHLSVEQVLALTAVLLTAGIAPCELDNLLVCLYPREELVIQI